MAARRRWKQMSTEQKHAICELARAGMSERKIAQFYCMSRNTVASILRRNRINNSVPGKRGRKYMLSQRCVRRLLRFVSINRFNPLYVIANEFRTQDGSKLSVRTIRRYLRKHGYHNYAAITKPFLSRKHMNARLCWANIYGNWSTEQWSTVAFSDESSFTIKPTSLRIRVWRKNRTAYIKSNMKPTFKSGYVTLSVWAAFSMFGRTTLVRINGSLNQWKYRDILEEHSLPFANKYHGGTDHFIFQHDNCGPHRAKSIKSYMSSKHISLLPWPAQSPDLNPIENLWAILKKKLRTQDRYPSNVDALYNQLSTIWDTLPEVYIKNLVVSMSRCADAVKRGRGSSTKY